MGEAYAFKLMFSALSPVHIGSGEGASNFKEALKLKNRVYMIPQSSWKGALRQFTVRAARSTDFGETVNRIIREHHQITENGMLYYHSGDGMEQFSNPGAELSPDAYAVLHGPAGTAEARKEISRMIAHCMCPVDALFGSPYFASLLTLSSSAFKGSPEFRIHVSIDRETMAASEHRVYTEEAVWPDEQIQLRATLLLPGKNDRLCRMDAGPLRKLTGTVFSLLAADGLSVGGSKSRGLGLLKLDPERSLYNVYPVDPRGWKPLRELIEKWKNEL